MSGLSDSLSGVGNTAANVGGYGLGAINTLMALKSGNLIPQLLARQKALADPDVRSSLVNSPFTAGTMFVGGGQVPNAPDVGSPSLKARMTESGVVPGTWSPELPPVSPDTSAATTVKQGEAYKSQVLVDFLKSRSPEERADYIRSLSNTPMTPEESADRLHRFYDSYKKGDYPTANTIIGLSPTGAPTAQIYGSPDLVYPGMGMGPHGPMTLPGYTLEQQQAWKEKIARESGMLPPAPGGGRPMPAAPGTARPAPQAAAAPPGTVPPASDFPAYQPQGGAPAPAAQPEEDYAIDPFYSKVNPNGSVTLRYNDPAKSKVKVGMNYGEGMSVAPPQQIPSAPALAPTPAPTAQAQTPQAPQPDSTGFVPFDGLPDNQPIPITANPPAAPMQFGIPSPDPNATAAQTSPPTSAPMAPAVPGAQPLPVTPQVTGSELAGVKSQNVARIEPTSEELAVAQYKQKNIKDPEQYHDVQQTVRDNKVALEATLAKVRNHSHGLNDQEAKGISTLLSVANAAARLSDIAKENPQLVESFLGKFNYPLTKLRAYVGGNDDKYLNAFREFRQNLDLIGPLAFAYGGAALTPFEASIIQANYPDGSEGNLDQFLNKLHAGQQMLSQGAQTRILAYGDRVDPVLIKNLEKAFQGKTVIDYSGGGKSK